MTVLLTAARTVLKNEEPSSAQKADQKRPMLRSCSVVSTRGCPSGAVRGSGGGGVATGTHQPPNHGMVIPPRDGDVCIQKSAVNSDI